jgi:HEAT repeat protein/beta-lactamase regulating signal transducer with metallopeptidase domain
MTSTFSATALAWLLTYAIHSSILLSLVWVLVRVRRFSPGASELLWKSAMLGGFLTASIQLKLDVRPAGTLMLQPPVVTAPATTVSRIDKPKTSTRTDAAQTEIAPQLQPSTGRLRPAVVMSRSSGLVAGWGLIALVLGLSYIARRLILVGRLGDRRAVQEDQLLDVLAQLVDDAGLRSTPLLTSSSQISSPVALGTNEICVPETVITELDLEQQQSLLAHELAHLARRDPVWLIVGSLIERVFWIQPLNRVASREIATSAEFLCDDWAVRRTGSGDPLARCLAQVAEWIQASPLGVPVAGMAEERSLLVSRVARLVEGVKPSNRSRRGVAIGAFATLVATTLVAPGVSGRTTSLLLADEPQRPAVADASSTQQQPTPAATQSAAPVSSRDLSAAQAAKADTGVVNALIARLGDENADVRRAAAHSLGQLKDSRAVPGLIAALKDSEPRVRASAAEALAEFEDSRAIAPLVDLLTDQSTEVRRNALDALSHFESNLPSAPIVRLLGDPDADVRHDAAHLVGRLHDRSAIGALAKLIGDPSADVREAAIEAIGELGDPSASIAIVPALSDANADVRQQAMSSLQELKAPIAEATLIALMRDRDSDVRQKAAELAGERSVVAAVPTLRRMLEDTNADVRESAIDALGNIADVAAYDALRDALTSKDAKVRRAAAEALGDRRL